MRYNKQFKEEAVLLSREIGIKQAAEQLGIPYYTLSGWRKDMRKFGSNAFPGSGHKKLSVNEQEQRIRELEKETREQQKTIEILKDAVSFFAERRKK